MAIVRYECPHCDKAVEIDESLLGENVDCPNCERPFFADPPRGRILDGTSDERDAVAASATPGPVETELVRVHPVLFRRHFIVMPLGLLAVIAGIAGVVMGLTGQALLGVGGLVLVVIGAGLLLVFGGYLASLYLKKISTTLIVTSDRTILREGVFNHRSSEVQHEDVRNVKSDRTLIERMLNYGDIALSSSGQDEMEIVANDIPDPEGIIQLIRERQ